MKKYILPVTEQISVRAAVSICEASGGASGAPEDLTPTPGPTGDPTDPLI